MTNKEKFTDELLVKTISNWFQEPTPTLNERLNEMPEGVFNYISLPNPSGWGMRIEGKMPNNMSKEEVLKGCGICKYGAPSFEVFSKGKFALTYNYD